MISMEFSDGRYRPVACCDVCKSKISDAKEGHALFPRVPGDSNVPIFLVHKACEARTPDELRARYAWQPLEAMIVYLSRNMGVKWGDEHAADTAKRLADMG